MKSKLLKRILIVVGIFIVGYIAGRLFENLVHGYKYREVDRTEISYANGSIVLKHAFESHGIALINTGTSIIEYDYVYPITIFKGQRGWQEPDPYVKEIKIENGSVVWDDARNKYTLKIEPLPKNTEQNDSR